MKYVASICLAWHEVKMFSLANNGLDADKQKEIAVLDKFFARCQHRVNKREKCLYQIKYE